MSTRGYNVSWKAYLSGGALASFVTTIVVGGGYAGLAASHYLSLAGGEHIVLERGRIGETWRTQRWDSFALNTNNRVSAFPGQAYVGPNPEGFALREELMGRFERYVAGRRLPVRIGVAVTELRAGSRTGIFCVHTSSDGETEVLESRNVIVASGFQNERKKPPLSSSVPESILQVHAADYRNPGVLPPGAVLVVGSAQSGCQIAEDLLGAGRRVFLSDSAVARVPRHYRGRDIVDWMIDTGFWDVRLRDLEDPKMQFAAQPQVSGVGPMGHTVSLQHLARSGAILVGRLAGLDGATLRFEDNVGACVQFADERSAFFKRMIDRHIERNGLTAPPPEPDPADRPDDGSAAGSAPSNVDLRAERVGTIVWCTGFTGSFAWVRVPVLDANGRPMHERGVSNVPGIYFLGAPWLYKRKSGVLYGMSEDAEYIAQHIDQRKRV